MVTKRAARVRRRLYTLVRSLVEVLDEIEVSQGLNDREKKLLRCLVLELPADEIVDRERVGSG